MKSCYRFRLSGSQGVLTAPRRGISTLILLFFALVLATCVPHAAQADEKRPSPNIVLIMADDLGRGELGCYGQQKISTPRLDRMAKEGMRFTQAYAGAPVCAPSRCVLLTGKHLGHAVVRDNREAKPEGQYPLPAEEITLAEVLKEQGYATAAIGKWGLGANDSTGSPLKQGFDAFFGYICQRHAHNHFPHHLWRNNNYVEWTDAGEKVIPPDQITPPFYNAFYKPGNRYSHDLFEEEALTFLRTPRDQPFFLYLPFTVPHLALQVPDDSLREYEDRWDDPAYKGDHGYTPHPTPRAAYAAMVSRLDRTVGRILDEIKKLGLEENTLVLFTSDNGPTHENVGGADSAFFHSAGEFRGYKGSAFEGGLRTPLLARWPGKIKAEAVSDLPVMFYDLLPTLAEVTGAKTPAGVDGLSFAPTLLGVGEQKLHDAIYWEFPGYGGAQAIRFGKWKAIRPKLRSGSLEIELYDLDNDPGEEQNVAEMHPELVQWAADRFAKEHTPSAEFPLPGIDVEPKKPAGKKAKADN